MHDDHWPTIILGRHTTAGFRKYIEDDKNIGYSTLWLRIKGVVCAVICSRMDAEQCLLYFSQKSKLAQGLLLSKSKESAPVSKGSAPVRETREATQSIYYSGEKWCMKHIYSIGEEYCTLYVEQKSEWRGIL